MFPSNLPVRYFATYKVCGMFNKNTIPKFYLFHNIVRNVSPQFGLLFNQLLKAFIWEDIFCANVNSPCNERGRKGNSDISVVLEYSMFTFTCCSPMWFDDKSKARCAPFSSSTTRDRDYNSNCSLWQTIV